MLPRVEIHWACYTMEGGWSGTTFCFCNMENERVKTPLTWGQTYLQFCDSVRQFLNVNGFIFLTKQNTNSLILGVILIALWEENLSVSTLQATRLSVLYWIYLRSIGFAPVIVCPWMSCICSSWTYDIHKHSHVTGSLITIVTLNY